MRQYHFEIKNGKIPSEVKQGLQEYFNLMSGKKVTLTLETYKKNRSNNQNRFYWGIVVKMISDYTGYNTDETHAYLKERFTDKQYVRIGDSGLSVAPSTTHLTTVQFEEYIARIQQWAIEDLDLYIPSPNEIETNLINKES